jgi:hypothetical protein
MRMKHRYRAFALGAALCAGATATAAISGIGLPAAASQQESAIFETLGAMRQLEPVQAPSATVVDAMELASNSLDGDAVTARSTLRTLRADLGVGQASIYAFSPGRDLTCMIFSPRSSGCSTKPLPTDRGLLLAFSPGGPGYPGLPSNALPALAGVAVDNVVSVVLVVNGKRSQLEIVNNAFFAELPRPPDGTKWVIELEVAFADGARRTVAIPDPRI